MKKKQFTIMYNKMYLVTPMVYEKLKNCLNKTDISNLTNLNKPFFQPSQTTFSFNNPPYHPYPFENLDKTIKKFSESEEKDENPEPFRFSPPFKQEKSEEEFVFDEPEMWEDPYYPKVEESQSDIGQMSFDDAPINWEQEIPEMGYTRSENVGTQTVNPEFFSQSVQTEQVPTKISSVSTQTEQTPKTFSSVEVQTSGNKKPKKKKKKTDEEKMDVSTSNFPPPPPPPPPSMQPPSSSLIQFRPTDIAVSSEELPKKRKLLKKPAKLLAIQQDLRSPLDYRMRNVRAIDYQPRLARHLEHFGLPLANRPSQIIAARDNRALVPYVPRRTVPQEISSISTSIPQYNPDEEYAIPIPQSELVYRQPPMLTYENRPSISRDVRPEVEFTQPLSIEYKPSSTTKPLKTYSRPNKRKLFESEDAKQDNETPKNLKKRKTLEIDLPKTYQKTQIKPPSFEKFDGKLQAKVKPTQYINVIEEQPEREKEKLKKSAKFLCDICGQGLSSAYNLARHKQRELKRQESNMERETQYKLWFNRDGSVQTKRTSSDAGFIPTQDQKRHATSEYEKWN